MNIKVPILCILIILILYRLSILLYNFYNFKYFKLTITNSIVKYPLTPRMLAVIDNFSTESTLKDIIESESPVIFYTKTPWSGDNNNYIKKDTKYFIIDTGYYYYYSGITGITGISGTSESVTIGGDNLDESIQIFDYNKYSDKIKYY